MSKDTNPLLEQVKKLVGEKKYKEALLVLDNIFISDEKNIDALLYQANCFNALGEIGKAIKSFNRLLLVDPSHTDAAISLSILYNDIGRYEDAKKVFDQANERVKSKTNNTFLNDVHVNKKFAAKHYELADMYMTYNRLDDALFEYNKVVALDGDNLEARIKIAKVFAKKGFVTKAFDELKRLKMEHPAFCEGRIALGVLYYANGKVLEAQAEWQKVLARNPANANAQMYLNLSKTATETSL